MYIYMSIYTYGHIHTRAHICTLSVPSPSPHGIPWFSETSLSLHSISTFLYSSSKSCIVPRCVLCTSIILYLNTTPVTGGRGGCRATTYIHIYVYMYICMYIYIYLSIFIYVYLFICTYICMQLYTQIYVSLHSYTRMHREICRYKYIYRYGCIERLQL